MIFPWHLPFFSDSRLTFYRVIVSTLFSSSWSLPNFTCTASISSCRVDNLPRDPGLTGQQPIMNRGQTGLGFFLVLGSSPQPFKIFNLYIFFTFQSIGIHYIKLLENKKPMSFSKKLYNLKWRGYVEEPTCWIFFPFYSFYKLGYHCFLVHIFIILTYLCRYGKVVWKLFYICTKCTLMVSWGRRVDENIRLK